MGEYTFLFLVAVFLAIFIAALVSVVTSIGKKGFFVLFVLIFIVSTAVFVTEVEIARRVSEYRVMCDGVEYSVYRDGFGDYTDPETGNAVYFPPSRCVFVEVGK